MITAFPRRGEVCFADLNPTRGHEQRGTRPVLVLSVDSFNSGPAELVTVLPLTSTVRPIPSRVEVQAPGGGLERTTLRRAEEVVRFLLGL